MNDGKVYRDVQKLRSSERLARLEVERVVSAVLDGVGVSTVLDVGTGSGIFAEAFAGRGLEVTGIDVQEAMLEAARAHVPAARFERAASEALPFPDGTFDLCFLGLVLHETRQPGRALQEAYRACVRRTAVLEWPYEPQPAGPPLGDRMKAETVVELASDAGFTTLKTFPLNVLVLYLFDK